MHRLKKAQTPCREPWGTSQRKTTELLSSFSQKYPRFDNGVWEHLDWTLRSPSVLVGHKVAACWRRAWTLEPEGSLTSTHPTPADWGWLAGAPELPSTRDWAQRMPSLGPLAQDLPRSVRTLQHIPGRQTSNLCTALKENQ